MALSDKQRKLGAGAGARPEKSPPPSPKDTSAFGGKSYLRGSEGKWWLKTNPDAYKITKLPEIEREKLWDKWFKGKEFVKPKEGEGLIKRLEMERSQAKSYGEQWAKDKEISLAKRLFGK